MEENRKKQCRSKRLEYSISSNATRRTSQKALGQHNFVFRRSVFFDVYQGARCLLIAFCVQCVVVDSALFGKNRKFIDFLSKCQLPMIKRKRENLFYKN